jgi:8-oxo-dGTP diphosphatase
MTQAVSLCTSARLRVTRPASSSYRRPCYSSGWMLIELLATIWKGLPRLARRHLAPLGQGRFTVTVAAMIFDEEGRILLLDHVFRSDGGWGVPGGFMKKDEQPETALRREVKEEIGIEVEAVELLFVRSLRKPRQLEIYFRARAIGHPEPCSFEIKSAAWFAIEDLPPELSKDQRRLIQRALPVSENLKQ